MWEGKYVELVIVEVEVECRNNQIFYVILEVVQLGQLPIDFRHFFKK
jgi:hypothetical protein